MEELEVRRLLSAGPTLPEVGADREPLPVVDRLVFNKGQIAPASRTPGTALAMAVQSANVSPALAPTSLEVSSPSSLTTATGTAFASATGSLTGKFVFTSPGHGWQWNTTLGRYATDRGDNNEIVEDFGNQDQFTFYADYLLRAGATVIPMRPVGRQVNEVVLDNDSPGVTFTGAWSNSTSTRYYDEDYGAVADSVPYRFASTVTGAESATATYAPNIPAAGFYPVYTWVLRGTDRTSQLYRINYSGGSTEIRVDHSKVGSGWVYLGTYYFDAGSSATSGSVTISNNAAVAGKVVIADAIRFGNGMGDYVWTGSGATAVSGYPREDENSYHWIARSVGVGTTLATAIGSGVTNVSAPSNFAQYMFAGTFGEAVYIGIHSNAGGGRGARGLIDADTVDRTPHQSDLALYLGRQINTDMQALNGTFEYNWDTGTTHTFTGQFGEIDLGASAKMDATIIEVAFHDSLEDARLMRDPKARDQIARSMLQGTIEYFQNWGGLTNTTSLPTQPTNIRAVSNASGQVTVNWAAGPATPAAVYGAAATGYRVYTSTNGYGFDLAATIPTNSTSVTLTGLDPNTPLYIRVAATNAGGESSPSEVMTALPSGGAKQVLIVNGFDRLDRTQNFRYAYAYVGDGLVDRVWPRYNNSFDYLVNVHAAINAARPGTHVASTSNEAVISGAVNLSDYDSVIWVLGNESTANSTFNATEQAKVEQFIAAGGHLFASGAEIGWDLDQQNNGRSFFENTLKGNYVSDDAGTYTATVAAGGIFAGLSNLVFSSGAASTGANAYSSRSTQMYDVSTPDAIAPQAGAVTALTYNNGSGAAGIQVAGTGGRGNVVLFGFPFETLTDATRRQQVMGRILDFFAVSATPGAPDLLAATDSGTSSTDNYTNFNNSSAPRALMFSVPGTAPGATVTLYADGLPIGSAVATGTTTTITTNGTSTLADGARVFTATQAEPGKAPSAASATLTVSIDTVAPTATFAAIASPRTTSLPSEGVTFSEPVAGLTAAAFTLTRYSAANLLTASQTLTGSGSSYTLNNLDAVTSNAGSYRLTLSASAGVTDAAGNPMAASPFVTWRNTAVTATAGADSIYVVRNATDTTAVDVTVNGSTYTLSVFNFGTLTILGAGGADSLTLDLSAGTPLSTSSPAIAFDAGPSSSLTIIGTAGDDTFTVSDASATLNGLSVTFTNAPANLSVAGSTGNDTLTLTNRSINFAADASLATSNLTLNLGTGASATFAATQHLAALNLSDNAAATLAAGGNKVLVAGALSITGAAKLDLTDNDLAVNAGLAEDQVRQLLAAGSLFSSTAAADPLHVTALGYALASDLGVAAFSGEPIAGAALLVKYTYLGDTDLDGRVTADDLARIDRGRARGLSTWLSGDSNYDAAVDAADVTLAHTAFRDQGPIL